MSNSNVSLFFPNYVELLFVIAKITIIVNNAEAIPAGATRSPYTKRRAGSNKLNSYSTVLSTAISASHLAAPQKAIATQKIEHISKHSAVNGQVDWHCQTKQRKGYS